MDESRFQDVIDWLVLILWPPAYASALAWRANMLTGILLVAASAVTAIWIALWIAKPRPLAPRTRMSGNMERILHVGETGA